MSLAPSTGAADITRLLPQKGAMCLLDTVVSVSGEEIVCRAVSHLNAANPLRADGRLGVLCGCEYGMQAAALHGALRTGDGTRPGRVASLRVTTRTVTRLDDPALGILLVTARRMAATADGAQYDFTLRAGDGRVLLTGGGTVAFSAEGPPA